MFFLFNFMATEDVINSAASLTSDDEDDEDDDDSSEGSADRLLVF